MAEVRARKPRPRDLRLPLLQSLDRLTDDDEFHEWMNFSEAANFLVDASDYENSSELVKVYMDEIGSVLEAFVDEGIVEKENPNATVYDTRFRLIELDAVARETDLQASAGSGRAEVQVHDANSTHIAEEPSLTFHDPKIVDSSSWTGIEARLARDLEKVDLIRTKMLEIETMLHSAKLTNHEMAKARAISEALIKLIESPEPEWKAIVELLQSPALGAALNIVGIVQILIGLILPSAS